MHLHITNLSTHQPVRSGKQNVHVSQKEAKNVISPNMTELFTWHREACLHPPVTVVTTQLMKYLVKRPFYPP